MNKENNLGNSRRDCTGDALDDAVQKLFGLAYLFPYQRLVVTNILEAASMLNARICRPGCDNAGPASIADGNVIARDEKTDDGGSDECFGGEDRAGLGRQIVILPTGAGKSLCFQLPAMLLSGPTLVIYPILSLMADQERRLSERGVVHGINMAPVILRGEQSQDERREIYGKIKSGETRFVIANPEVLLTPGVLKELPDLGIIHIVIDEAHCVAEWGESFRPSYLEIDKIIKASGAAIVTAFTATASSPVLEKIENYIFSDGGARKIIGNPNRMNIHYAARGVILRDMAVRDLLLKKPLPALVFSSSRRGVEKLARYLREEFLFHNAPYCQTPYVNTPSPNDIRFYHAGLSREEKKIIENWYLKNPKGILVSTCAFGMGVDKADIRTVIHRDCPSSVEAYLQESGRAGRDGGASQAILLWGPEDAYRLGRIQKEQERSRFEKLINYARDNNYCRREALLDLLNYEGQKEIPDLACCDVCDRLRGGGAGHIMTADGESLREEAGLLDFFGRNRRRYTADEAAQALSEITEVSWREAEIKQALSYLLSVKKLKKLKGPFWKGRLDLAGRGAGGSPR